MPGTKIRICFKCGGRGVVPVKNPFDGYNIRPNSSMNEWVKPCPVCKVKGLLQTDGEDPSVLVPVEDV